MKKYIEIFKYSLKQNLTFKTNYIFSIFSLAIHLFVFNELWDYILQGKEVVGLNKNQLIWYIIITEFITYSFNRTYKNVSDMVKNGDIANLLTKPVDYICYKFMEDISVIIKVAINVISIIVIGLILTGPIKCTLSSILFTIVSTIIGIITEIFIQIFIGLLAFKFEDNKGIWLIVQKLSLLVVFTPVEFYPNLFQKILYCLPTTYMVYVPARIFIGLEIKNTILLILIEFICLIIWYMGTRLLYKRGVEQINVNGG